MTTLRLELEKNGYTITEDECRADYVIVNTCSVTSFTESKTRRLLASISASAPQARILVTGCLAQQKPEEIREYKNVEWVVGNTFKNDILSILQKDRGVYHIGFDKYSGQEFRIPEAQITQPESDQLSRRTRFPIKIQEGCNFRCSYCIVPSLRGPSRSASSDQILDVCKSAIAAGYKELILTGTHIGQFGRAKSDSLTALVKQIISIEGNFRVRLSSLDPRDLNSELLELIGGDSRVCDHLHVSLQSLSEKVLRGMNRPYENLNELINQLVSFRERFPSAGLGTDLIVGFPGESQADFEVTLNNVRKINFSYAHIFRYSKRPGTPAASFPDQISEKEKTSRSAILRSAIEESRIRFIDASRSFTKKIIVESENPVRGLTSNYLHVEIKNTKGVRNTWLDVMVISNSQDRYCQAQPVTCEVV